MMTLRMQSTHVIVKRDLVVRKNQHPLWLTEGLPMILLVIPFLYLIFVDPFEDPLQTILEVLYLGVILGITILHLVRSWREADEVELATTTFSVAAGAVFGLLGASALLVVMPNVPIVTEFIGGLATISPKNKLPPPAAGFALGIATTLLLIMISGFIAYAVRVRWMARR